MERYWDLSDSERANLAQDKVEALLRVELMENGVVHPERPLMKPVEQIEVAQTTVFGIEYQDGYAKVLDCYFLTIEEAQKFLELHPMTLSRDWEIEERYSFPVPLAGMSIKPTAVADEKDVFGLKSRLAKNKENKKANEAAEKDYAAAMKAVEKATEQVWNDWYDQRRVLEKCQQIQKTWEEYKSLTGGKTEIAATFLAKAYRQDQIELANEWLGLGIPVTEEVNTGAVSVPDDAPAGSVEKFEF